MPAMSERISDSTYGTNEDAQNQLQQFDFTDYGDKENRASYISRHKSARKGPAMLARDAEGDRDHLAGLKLIATFLRDTAPTADANPPDPYWPLPDEKTSPEHTKPTKRRFRVGSRKSTRTAAPHRSPSRDAARKRSSLKNVNSVQRVSQSGHKYLHITPLGSPSLGTNPCELEANLERPIYAEVQEKPPSRPATATLDFAPSSTEPATGIFPLESAPVTTERLIEISPLKTAPTNGRASGSSDIQNYVLALQTEMQNRFQSPPKSKKPSHHKSAGASELKALPRLPDTPPDQEVSAILRATTAAKVRQDPPTPVSTGELLATRAYTPTRGLQSQSAQPPSLPPSGPLPELPKERKASEVSTSASTAWEDVRTPSLGSIFDDRNVHPAFRRSPRPMSSANAFQPPPSTDSIQTSRSDDSMQQITEPSTLIFPVRPSHKEEVSAENRSNTPTPQTREDRIRNRKLRDIQATKEKTTKARPKRPPTPGSSPDPISRPSTAISAVPTMTSESITDVAFGGAPPTPTPSYSSPELQTSFAGSASADLSKRSNSSPEPSPPFPYDEPAWTANTNNSSESMQEVRELLPAIRLPPLRPAQRSDSVDTTATHIAPEIFPMPHQRLSFASHSSQPSLSNAYKYQRDTSVTAKKLFANRQGSGNLTNTQHANGMGQHSQSSSLSARSTEVSLDARVAQLERQNNLLEAALLAVLKTGGLLNGCPNCTTNKHNSDGMSSTSSGSAAVGGRSSAGRYSPFPTTSGSDATAERTAEVLARHASQNTMGSRNSSQSASFRSHASNENVRDSGSEVGQQSKALDLYLATRRDLASLPAAMQVMAGSVGRQKSGQSDGSGSPGDQVTDGLLKP